MDAEDLIYQADVTLSTMQSGEVRCNVGDAASGQGYTAACPVWAPYGYLAIPNLPDDGGACQALVLVDGDQRHVIATRDHRFHPQGGNLEPGDIALVSSSAAKVVIKNRTASVILATTDDGTQTGNGTAITCAPDELRLQSKYGAIIIDKDGIFITHVGGASVVLTAATLPAPMSMVNITATRCQIDARTQIGYTAVSGGSGVFMAPVIAPVASPQTGIPVPVAEGIGVSLGITAQNVTFS